MNGEEINAGLIDLVLSKFSKQNSAELYDEILVNRRRLSLLCYEFPKLDDQDTDTLRKFTLTIKILIRILEHTLTLPPFTFSWEDIISTFLYLENDPNFMIKSMIREVRRISSFKTSLAFKKDEILQRLRTESVPRSRFAQKRVTDFLDKW